MAEITQQGNTRKGRKTQRNRVSLKIDFTPMVDLGFLLITFFMLTTTLSEKYVVALTAPVNGPDSPLADTSALTVILSGGNKVYYYFGQRGDTLSTTDFSPKGIRRVLLSRNQDVFNKVNQLDQQARAGQISSEQLKEERKKLGSNKYSLMVMIKSDENSRYGNLVDMLDEIQITHVLHYTVMNLEPEEKQMLAEVQK
jgi:biopolymer transport protein ExbD